MVIFSNNAKRHLRQIHDYIKNDSFYYAKKVVDDIVKECKKLSDNPRRGRVVPEIQNKNIREIFIYSYRLIYELSNNKDITILSIIHFAKNFHSIT